MFVLKRTALSALCLSLILPCTAQVLAQETPAADADAAPATRQALPERSQEDAQALERQVPKDEQQTLQAGSDSFLALWKPANTPAPEGVVIIVPGAGESADWPRTVGPLRRKFPDAKWASLSLSLPDLLAESPVARKETPAAPPQPDKDVKGAPAKATPADANANIAQATAAETENSESAEAPASTDPAASEKADAERIFARLDAAVAYAQQQNARSVVLLGSGSGAYWSARYISERQPPQVQKLVMVAAQNPARVEHSLDSLAATLKLPTADFYYANQAGARQAAVNRLQAIKRLKDSSYHQVALTAMPGNQAAEQEQLFRRIRGWLSPQAVD